MIQLRKELQILRANGAGTGPIEIEETEQYQDMKERLERQIEDYQTALARFGLKITSYLRKKTYLEKMKIKLFILNPIISSSTKARNLMLQIESTENERKKISGLLERVKQKADQVRDEHRGEMTLVGEKLLDLEADDNTATVFNALRGLHSDILSEFASL